MNKPDSNLIKKYSVPGPRYTSYPTVPFWATYPSENEWIDSLREAVINDEDKGCSFYIHIPFCETLCTYCGCNTRITRKKDVGIPYIETVLKEWKLYREKLALERPVLLSELHLGGGTPTFLSADELKFLLTEFFSTVRIAEDPEFSLEAHPNVTTRDQLEVLAKLGFKRLSLGIQDFDPKVQEVVNRIQSVEQVKNVTEWARELGFTSINYDLIYGLPFQTMGSIENTIEEVGKLRPDRIAFYSYAHVPWIKPAQRRFTEDDLPNPDEKRALYERGLELLSETGYKEIGMDHFALETDSLWQATLSKNLHRNFMGYIPKHVGPLVGLGVSSIGDTWNVFAQNEKLLEKYVDRVNNGEIPIHRGHILTEEDRIIRKHILNLMTRFETKWTEDFLWTDYLNGIISRLEEFEKDTLVKTSENSCTVTEKGRAFLRNICMTFDAQLARKSPEREIFSKTI